MTTTTSRTTLIAGSGAGALVLAFGFAPPAAAQPLVIDEGHVDIVAVEYDAEDHEIELEIHNDTGIGPVHPDPDNTIFLVRSDAWNAAGTVATLPELGAEGLLWPGFSYGEHAGPEDEGPDVALYVDTGDPDFELAGDLTVVQGGSDPVFALGATTNVAGPLVLEFDDHQHFAWEFTEPGSYVLPFHAEVVDDPDVSDTMTVTIVVEEP